MNTMHDSLLHLIDKEIKNVIKEQFNVNDIDFNNTDDTEPVSSIFNNEIVNPYYVYNNIMNNQHVHKYEIEYLDALYPTVTPDNFNELQYIIMYYSDHFTENSLNWIDVSGFTEMRNLFSFAKYTGDISKWDVSNVTNMEMMFNYSLFNNDISRWDVSHVTDMTNMFALSHFNSAISDWDVSHVTSMYGMFNDSQFNQDISRWDVHNVENMNNMFNNSKFNQNISRWNVSNVLYYNNVFNICPIDKKYMPKKFRK